MYPDMSSRWEQGLNCCYGNSGKKVLGIQREAMKKKTFENDKKKHHPKSQRVVLRLLLNLFVFCHINKKQKSPCCQNNLVWIIQRLNPDSSGGKGEGSSSWFLLRSHLSPPKPAEKQSHTASNTVRNADFYASRVDRWCLTGWQASVCTLWASTLMELG